MIRATQILKYKRNKKKFDESVLRSGQIKIFIHVLNAYTSSSILL